MSIPQPTLLALLAEVGAMRAILARMMALHLAQSEADPATAALGVKALVCRAPTRPPSDHALDAATSDLLAAMTDERIEALMDDIIASFVPGQDGGRPSPLNLPV